MLRIYTQQGVSMFRIFHPAGVNMLRIFDQRGSVSAGLAVESFGKNLGLSGSTAWQISGTLST
ncbi:MAG: hypothetical protein EA411_10820 [Saprospirales bacterium]|nr:MAG: hypothetical protein EA411_10820 [Saprospirales bacterium]